MEMASSSTILRKPWLNLARGIWIIMAGTAVIVFVVGSIVVLRDPLSACTPAEAVCGPWIVSLEDMALAQKLQYPVSLMLAAYIVNAFLPKLCFALVGFLIFWRRSDDWMALLLSMMLIGFIIEGVPNLGAFTPIVNLLYATITAIFGFLPFIFPNGRFIPRNMRWLAPPVVILTVIATSLPQLGIPVNDQAYALANMIIFFVWFVLGGYAVIYRYKYVSGSIERQQTKWVMAGILGTFALFIPFTIIAVFFPPSQPSPERLAFFFLVYLPIGFLSYLFIPGSIAFAILRYRLYDIDVIIRKTLVYASLSALLVLVYLGMVIFLQSVFDSVSGQQSPIAIVISTLLIAAMFNPLRHRIQDAIDRRFYRKKYDAQQVLAQFALTARDETNMDVLTAELMSVMQETMQPSVVNLWFLRQTSSVPQDGEPER